VVLISDSICNGVVKVFSLVVGSNLLGGNAEKVLGRRPMDTDIWCDQEFAIKQIHEARDSSRWYSPTKLVIDIETRDLRKDITILSPDSLDMKLVMMDRRGIKSHDILYTIKMSHRFKKNVVSFEKTRRDILNLRGIDAKIPKELSEWYARRVDQELDYSHPNLNQSKRNFFSDNVPMKFDHDFIHEEIALFGKPAYTMYKRDGAEVACDKDKFFSLDNKYRQAGVLEEVGVLALERSLIPHPKVNQENRQSITESIVEFAQEKLLTGISSGWFREYGWEEWPRIDAGLKKQLIQNIMRFYGKHCR